MTAKRASLICVALIIGCGAFLTMFVLLLAVATTGDDGAYTLGLERESLGAEVGIAISAITLGLAGYVLWIRELSAIERWVSFALAFVSLIVAWLIAYEVAMKFFATPVFPGP